MRSSIILFLLIANIGSQAIGTCVIFTNKQKPALGLDDGLYRLLSQANPCPMDVLSLDNELEMKGWQLSSSMVANRGRLNPNLGSFSFFEMATLAEAKESEIFFGHFTHLVDGAIELDQEPKPRKLLIEAISFDETKGLYNFYELIGKGNHAQWFYRGDSRDALLDNAYLHREPPLGEAKFGNRMRCSACHNSGGPIMKERALPHNDWWTTDSPLYFGENHLSAAVLKRVNRLNDASLFSTQVTLGIEKLNGSAHYKKATRELSLQEQLRPLFCTTQINLSSSTARLHDTNMAFDIPSRFFLNPSLGTIFIQFEKAAYQQLLHGFGLRFLETNELDADHIWLTPVVSDQDILAVKTLSEDGIISEKIIKDILMIDFSKPLFSTERCQLLTAVPKHYSNDWLTEFITNLSAIKRDAAHELINYLLDKDSDKHHHEPALKSYIDNLNNKDDLPKLFQALLHLRQEAFTNEIAKNPQGQILEPGFRVIFPETWQHQE